MNCYWCKTELIIGGDIDIEDGMVGYPEFSVMTNLSCPKCHSAVDVWHPSEKLIKEYEDYE